MNFGHCDRYAGSDPSDVPIVSVSVIHLTSSQSMQLPYLPVKTIEMASWRLKVEVGKGADMVTPKTQNLNVRVGCIYYDEAGSSLIYAKADLVKSACS